MMVMRPAPPYPPAPRPPTDTHELRPFINCPYCLSSTVRLHRTWFSRGVQLVCDKCKSRGPMFFDVEPSVSAKNRAIADWTHLSSQLRLRKVTA